MSKQLTPSTPTRFLSGHCLFGNCTFAHLRFGKPQPLLFKSRSTSSTNTFTSLGLSMSVFSCPIPYRVTACISHASQLKSRFRACQAEPIAEPRTPTDLECWNVLDANKLWRQLNRTGGSRVVRFGLERLTCLLRLIDARHVVTTLGRPGRVR